ncbi:cation diffusion facilitator family transporter [Candidatus Peregrinibacteria bacterium]|nr:cation diffusion facilitator family transporter [Candidatus Peregrinibacteria bacterium]
MNKSTLKEGEKVARNSIFHLFGLGIIKLTAGLVTGMHVVIADSISTFADTLGVFASYFGLKLSRKSANKRFEYGYYKIETFAAFLISLGIIYAGIEIFKDGIQTVQDPTEGQYRYFAITATILAILHSIRLSKKLETAGKKVNSLSLIANAKDKKMDVFAGFIILISIIANYKQIPYVEGTVTILISLFILKVGIFSSKESLFFLLDYWDNPKLLKKIKGVFKKEKDFVLGIRKIRLRRAGTFIFGEAFIEINPYADIGDLREELEILKNKVLSLNPYIKDFSIYTHISEIEKVKVGFPVKSGEGLESKLASNIKETKAYLFAYVEKGKVKKFYSKKLSKKQKKPVELAEFLKKEKPNIIINNKLNSLIYYNLRRVHSILIYPNFSDINNVKQTLRLLLIDV